MKFCVDIIYRIETCQTIQLYLLDGATFTDCFASFSNPVAVTKVARSVVFPSNWASMRPYSWLWLITSTQQVELVLMGFGQEFPRWPSNPAGPVAAVVATRVAATGPVAATQVDRLGNPG